MPSNISAAAKHVIALCWTAIEVDRWMSNRKMIPSAGSGEPAGGKRPLRQLIDDCRLMIVDLRNEKRAKTLPVWVARKRSVISRGSSFFLAVLRCLDAFHKDSDQVDSPFRHFNNQQSSIINHHSTPFGHTATRRLVGPCTPGISRTSSP